MQQEAVQVDICAEISKLMLGPEAISGTTMKLDVAKDGQYIVNESSSGSIAPTETIETVQCTLDFSNLYTVHPRITNDLLEDSLFDLIALHISEAGRQIGEKASDLAITILGTAPDGDGTLNATTGDTANTSSWYDSSAATDDIVDSISYNAVDGFVSDTLLCSHHTMLHNIIGTSGLQYAESLAWDRFMQNGYPARLGPLNILYNDGAWMSHDFAWTTCHNIIFTKNMSLVTGRKRWMRLEKYSEPVKDLTGFVISFRQDSVTLYKDSICVYSEN